MSFRIFAKGALLIAGSSPAEQYSMEIFAGNCRYESPRGSITSATERTEDVTLSAGEDPGGPFPEDLKITIANTFTTPVPPTSFPA